MWTDQASDTALFRISVADEAFDLHFDGLWPEESLRGL